ncbi:hypothetical protein HK100_010024 [Physocladia obscura]|uniref:Uncharacterized protein n=1 Tax=Physocladia obscura TaxID=109957 RepID=A0AAD5T8V7_9FUNG|nr:hypothetical protein HK100_010024 [Physocladia obscura]
MQNRDPHQTTTAQSKKHSRFRAQNRNFREPDADQFSGNSTANLPKSSKFSAPDSSANRNTALESKFSNLSLVSRGFTNLDETSLLDKTVQREYFDWILTRTARFKESQKEIKAKPSGGDLDSILASLRKLREGILASKEVNDFSIRVYETSVDICLEAGNFAELLKSLTVLVGTMYTRVNKTVSPKDDRQAEITTLLLLYLICYVPSCKKSKSNSQSSALPPASIFESKEVFKLYKKLTPLLQNDARIINAMKMQESLLNDLDFVGFRKAWNFLNAPEVLIAKNILPHIRQRTLEILAKAYFTFPLKLLAHYTISTSASASASTESDESNNDTLETLLKERFGADYNQRVINETVHFRIAMRK